ncbi:gamma-glutamylcyclotransferase [Piscinibacter sakaiensis]|uniref:gamma-glutamylcyclotransferase n=1 Tax=Piscinibacter sakaiensis TaxID=1547922 RepID=UPI003AAAAACE
MNAGLPPPLRDPAPLLQKVRREWGGKTPLWVFGYASLIWRPEFDAAEQRPASVHGWHRSLKMTSRVNRGTPESPGLVFALVPGGSCRGMVYRLAADSVDQDLERLWHREMPTGVYDPKWLMCRTASGPVRALAFTLSRRSPSFTGPIDDDAMLRILRVASGRYGRTFDYLVETATCLRACGIRDRSIERLVQLAKGHGLHHAHFTEPSSSAAALGLGLPPPQPLQISRPGCPDE